MGRDLVRLGESGSIPVREIDASPDPAGAEALGVESTPTLIELVDGVERSRVGGMLSADEGSRFVSGDGGASARRRDAGLRLAAGLAVAAPGWASAAPLLVAVGVGVALWGVPGVPRGGMTPDNIAAVAPALYRFAQALVRDPDRAADLVQDTLVPAIECSDRYRGEAPPRAWLKTHTPQSCRRSSTAVGPRGDRRGGGGRLAGR
jgi:hypothetical protein